MGRKKKPETLKKEREKLEKDIEVLEKVLNEKEEEIQFNKKIKKKQEIIKEDLMKQLENQEKIRKTF